MSAALSLPVDCSLWSRILYFVTVSKALERSVKRAAQHCLYSSKEAVLLMTDTAAVSWAETGLLWLTHIN